MDKTIDLGLKVPPGTGLEFRTIIDPERLLQLHPHWHIEGVDVQGDSISARLKDHASEQQFEMSFDLTFPAADEFAIKCTDGPLGHIHFFAREQRMHVSYSDHGPALSSEEEQNLTLWLQSIRQYLRLYLSTTPYTIFFRFLMNKALLKMNPSQRKICLMLYRFTLLEIVVILIIVFGYFAFGR